MTLGTSRPRNWGTETQQIALRSIMRQRRVAYRVTRRNGLTELWLAPSQDGTTLPFVETVAELVNVRRGRWEAHHPFDGRLLASGASKRDVIRATIQVVWH